MNLILHEAPRLLANILILQPIDERYIWMPTTAILGEPEVFGEISFLDSRPPVATVIATRDSIVLTIPGKALQQKLDDGGKFAAHFYRAIALFLADRMRNTAGLLGYGQEYPPDSPMQLVRDLSPQVLESLPIARRRLDLFVRRLRGY
ncbi:MAG: cyclic nucleotide-binding domain-containing protein [Cyanobacteria bacterium]|nr:cyclic nucleotide-binding domain-containing protein [Cyanobacteriota bacterium]